MSTRSFIRRPWIPATAVALGTVLLAGSCGFPDHSFISDDDFYGGGGQGASAAGGAATGGTGGTGAGGSAGAGAAGTTGTGGIVVSGGTGGSGGTNVVDGSAGAGATGGVATGGAGGSTGGATGTGAAPPVDAGRVEAGARDEDAGQVEAGPTCPPLFPDLCSGSCVDLLIDDTNCGTCGVLCAFDEDCVDGLCDRICDVGLAYCSGNCVDFLSDKSNCGDCGQACNGQDICNDGNCEPPCDPGLSLCNGNCVNLLTDEASCGNCVTTCDPGDVCELGTCVIDCGSLTRCGTVCVDLDTDENHCGACNDPCNGTDVCSGRLCQTLCDPLINCGGTCVDPTSNDSHCNGCNNACPTGQDCIGSSCTDLVEDCTNGSDDDEDLLADCADPECTAGFTCAPTPSGWTGPVAIWSGTAGFSPVCPSAYPSSALSAFADMTVDPSTCPSCTCTVAGGSSCSDFVFYLDDTADCSASLVWAPTISSGSCDSHNLGGASPSAHSAQLKGSRQSYATGSCNMQQIPSGVFPVPSWNEEVLACTGAPQTGAGCAAGKCVPRPQAPFGTQVCIFRGGVSACPAAYPNPGPGGVNGQYFESWSDSRSCSSCTCGGVDCGGTVTVYTDSVCSADATQIATDGTCTTIPLDPTQGGTVGNPTDTRSFLHTGEGPVCGNVPRSPIGSVTPDTAVTVCCQ